VSVAVSYAAAHRVILLMAIASSATRTALSPSMDTTKGIVARFRTMGIARSSVLFVLVPSLVGRVGRVERVKCV
jgi:hypothetical protein